VTVITSALRRLLAAVVLIACSVAAQAASLTYNNTANSVNRGGAATGFYNMTLDTVNILAMCDARFSTINPPVTWNVDVWTYADIQAGAVGKFNSPSTPATLAKYSQAGWLFSQIATLAPNDYSGQADINEAIWKVMSPSYALVGAGASIWYTNAIDTTHDTFDWSGVMRVLTPNPLIVQSVDVQEFLAPVVPIPAAVWLFGSALGLLGLARRRAA
jgi:hypothetical protein